MAQSMVAESVSMIVIRRAFEVHTHSLISKFRSPTLTCSAALKALRQYNEVSCDMFLSWRRTTSTSKLWALEALRTSYSYMSEKGSSNEEEYRRAVKVSDRFSEAN